MKIKLGHLVYILLHRLDSLLLWLFFLIQSVDLTYIFCYIIPNRWLQFGHDQASTEPIFISTRFVHFVVFSDPSNFKALDLFSRVRLKLHQAFFCFDMIILVWKFSWFSHGRFWEASLIKLHSCSWISSFRITMIRSWMRPRISTISRRLNS